MGILAERMDESLKIQRDIHAVLTSDEILQRLGVVLGNPAIANKIKAKLVRDDTDGP